MEIRSYQPGDEIVQAEIYNEAASALPGFKRATPDDLKRRWEGPDAVSVLRLYAVDDANTVVGYCVLSASGRMSYPWCRPSCERARNVLFAAVMSAAARRALDAVWTTYRQDWSEILAYFKNAGFDHDRDYINYLADLHNLPASNQGRNSMFSPMSRDEFRQIAEIAGGVYRDLDPFLVASYYDDNQYFSPSSLFAINDKTDGHLRGVGMVIADSRYADPTQVDPLMPCFRLGAFGTESERHKRVKGLVSFLFDDVEDGLALLTEAARRLRANGLIHAAAQVPSDAIKLVEFHDAYFQRRGSFPILSRSPASFVAESETVATAD